MTTKSLAVVSLESTLGSAASAARLIDHTLLKPEATADEITKLCREGRALGVFSICVNSRWMSLVAHELAGSKTIPITVVGFPLGAMLTKAKVSESVLAIEQGAHEIDMVMDIGAFKSGLFKEVEHDISEVVKASSPNLVKVILETCLLNDHQIVEACKICVHAGAAFVKTSTGFGKAGATPDHVRLMRQTVGPNIGVKASGGIRELETFVKMIEAGANRVGSSASAVILKELH